MLYFTKKSKYNHTLFKTPKNNNNKKAPVGAFLKIESIKHQMDDASQLFHHDLDLLK